MDYTKEFLGTFDPGPPEYMPTSLSSQYSFLSCLSQKKDRAIFLVADKQTGKKVILKITMPQSPDQSRKEYELLQKLDHPSIPKALHYEDDAEGREYLVREYHPGDTLDRVLQRDGVFDAMRVLDIAKRLCGILAYLHRQKPSIIYRDIKPQNIVVTANGNVSLIDFGISREYRKSNTTDTVIVGNLRFFAPEMGLTESDPRTDIFMLGLLMTYLATGELEPREGISLIESNELLRLCKKCTNVSPDKRFSSVKRLEKAIDRILTPPTRKEYAAGTIAAVLALSVGLFAWSYLRTAEEPAVYSLVGAGGQGYEQEVKIPVTIQALYEGQPYSDCVVAVDNHYWYQPTAKGQAELYVYAYDDYRARAVSGNRTAFMDLAVTRDAGPIDLAFDIAETPEAPEYLSLDLEYGQAHEVLLDVSGAEDITFRDSPDGVAAEERDGQFYLIIPASIKNQGHYYFLAEVNNEASKADMSISLTLAEDKQAIPIATAEELDKVRENLAGHYILENDIDLSGFESWAPIGDAETPFTGTFDGAGYTITGMQIKGKESSWYNRGGLFGTIERGTIRNVILRDASLFTPHPDSAAYGCIAGSSTGGLIENCAVFGSSIYADLGLESGIGGICGINAGVIRNCWSDTEIEIFTGDVKSWSESMSGGICGINRGFIADCGNTGNITSISIAGGVTGFTDMGITTRCYNVGNVTAPSYFDAYLPGGVSHLLGRGYKITYCAFEEGTAQLGASVFNGGTLLGLTPLKKESFRDFDSLAATFHIPASDIAFAYASLDSYYPIPTGVLSLQTPAPVLQQDGREVTVAALEGVMYFYTTDGSDPHTGDTNGVEEIRITLSAGQSLRVFAAREGCYDSDTIEYKV